MACWNLAEGMPGGERRRRATAAARPRHDPAQTGVITMTCPCLDQLSRTTATSCGIQQGKRGRWVRRGAREEAAARVGQGGAGGLLATKQRSIWMEQCAAAGTRRRVKTICGCGRRRCGKAVTPVRLRPTGQTLRKFTTHDEPRPHTRMPPLPSTSLRLGRPRTLQVKSERGLKRDWIAGMMGESLS